MTVSEFGRFMARREHMISSVVAMKAILLAGGKGTRLRPLTIHTPKPIVPIFDRPFLHYQLDLLKQVPEIDEVILSLNYQPRRIEEIFGDGSDTGLAHPLRRRAGAARHRRRRPLRRRVAARIGRRLQRRRADAGRPRRRHRAAPRAQGQGDDRADAGREPDAPTAWSRPTRDGNIQRFLEKPNADEITCDTINAGIYVLEPDTFDRIPKDTPWSIERSFFPSLIERGETFVAYVYRGYWIDIGTPEKYMQVHRDIMDGRYRAAPFADAAVDDVGLAAGARRGRRRRSRAPASSTRARSSRPARASARTASSAGSATSRSTRVVEQRDRLGQHAASARKPSCAASILGRHCHIGRNAVVEDGVVLGDKSVVTDYSRLVEIAMSLCVNPDIFKAYDVRGIYPGEINEDAARAIGAAFVAYLEGEAHRASAATCGCRRRRSPRRSSTARRRRAPTSSTTG